MLARPRLKLPNVLALPDMRLDGPVATGAIARAMDGVHIALWVAVAFAVFSSVVALFIRDEDARHTMVRRT